MKTENRSSIFVEEKKKAGWLLAAGLFVIVAIASAQLFFSRNANPLSTSTVETLDNAEERSIGVEQQAATEPDLEVFDEWEDEPVGAELIPYTTCVSSSNDSSASPIEISSNSVTHNAADFKKGKLENIIVTDGLQLGNDLSHRVRHEPYQYSGVYFSPVFALSESFDTLIPTFKAQTSENERLIFEVCTARVPGEWSPWEEAHQPGQRISTDTFAKLFQYRITLFADELATNSRVQRVTITTERGKSTVGRLE